MKWNSTAIIRHCWSSRKFRVCIHKVNDWDNTARYLPGKKLIKKNNNPEISESVKLAGSFLHPGRKNSSTCINFHNQYHLTSTIWLSTVHVQAFPSFLLVLLALTLSPPLLFFVISQLDLLYAALQYFQKESRLDESLTHNLLPRSPAGVSNIQGPHMVPKLAWTYVHAGCIHISIRQCGNVRSHFSVQWKKPP